MIKLLKYLKKTDWLLMFICIGLIVGQVWLELTMPDYVAEITTLITQGGTSMSQIWIAGLKMLACALGSALLMVITGYFASKVASSFSCSLRGNVFSKISEFGVAEMKQFSVPSLITRTTNDITQIQNLIAMGFQVMVKAPVLAIWAIVKIFGKSWELSVVVMSAVGILLVTVVVVVAFVMPKFKKMQKQVDDINRVAEESLNGVKVIRAFNADEYQQQKFEKVNENLTKTNLFSLRMLAILFPVLSLVMSGLSLAIYYVGSGLINNAPVAERVALLGDVVSFSTYGMYVIMSFLMLAMIFMILPRAEVSAKRISEVLNAPVLVVEGSSNALKGEGEIEFKNVDFKYPNSEQYILKDVNFKIEKGQTLAIVGASGSGKSTLASLIARLYDATDGEILIDDKNIKDYTFESLYNKIGYISQKAIVFSDTVANNVAFGKQGQLEQTDIEQAIEIAQGKDFVENMPNGYNSDISQGGINISGGQKQRLAIARAIAKKPEILIFDDSFSALDFKTDKKLREQLSTNLKDTTCVIVASRIGTIKNADQILVLDENGSIAGKGTHEELLKTCEVYKEIALSQFSKQELEG